MRIFIICSKAFYGCVPDIERKLLESGHQVTLPNSFDDPEAEDRYRNMGSEEHAEWKAGKFSESLRNIEQNDAVLVLNFEKDGIPNYIGGATFIEIYDAFRLGKKIFFYNDIPDGMLRDELSAFSPIVIHGDMRRIR